MDVILLENLRKQKYVICPAWPYVNAVPHLGTVLHLLGADIYVRYLTLRGADVISATGSVVKKLDSTKIEFIDQINYENTD